MSRREPVTVQILDREYRIACEDDERQELMQAALHLDEQMRDVRDNARIVGMDKIAVLAALNISHELLKARQREAFEADNVHARIRKLRAKLDEALSTPVQ